MLRVETISKEFPGVKALSDVSLAFAPGEIHAVVGENGAGKSTLIKIICGIYQPDDGKLALDDEPLSLHGYSDAMALGIQLVSQEIQVIPKMTIAENILLHRIDRFRRRGAIDWGSIGTEAAIYTKLVGLDLPVLTPAGGLSAAQKQLVMIAKALSSDAQVLILDEPTSSLTLHEANNLFGVLRGLRERGVAIIFVSHKLEEVLDIADRVSVLRDGRFVGSHPTAELTKDAIVTMMLGRSAVTESLGSLDIDYDTIVLEARGITAPDMFEGLGFRLHAGEILGFYGLVGSGRTELAQILIGEDRAFSGEVLIRGEAARISGMADALSRYRLGYVSENRKEKGLILRASINTNIAITVWDRISRPIGRHQPHQGAGDRSALHGCRRGAGDRSRADRGQPIGRQPAEGLHREVAGRRLRHAHRGRADDRGGHRRQGGHPPADLGPGQEGGQVHHPDQLGPAGDGPPRPPDPGVPQVPRRGRDH